MRILLTRLPLPAAAVQYQPLNITSDHFALNQASQAPNRMESYDQKPLVTDDVFHAEATAMGCFAHVFPSFKRPMNRELDTARLEPLIQNHKIRLWKPGENRVTAKLTREGFLPC